MITQKIIINSLQKSNLKLSDADLNQQVNNKLIDYKKKYPATGQFEKSLGKLKITEDELKESIRRSIITDTVLADALKDITVNDNEIEAYYNENIKTQFTSVSGVSASHILITDEKKAKDLKAQLDGGADFAKLAKENSIDLNNKYNEGNLGFISDNSKNYTTEFMNTLKKLKEGQVSEPVKDQYGYHLIKVTKIKDSKDIPLDNVKSLIKYRLLNQKRTSAFKSKIQELAKGLKIQVNDKYL